MTQPASLEQDLQTYQTLLDLWQAENPIKTIKLQFLLATNAGLLGVLQLNGGLAAENILLTLGAFVLNVVWSLSIGRTSLFQKVWKNKLDEIAHRYPDDARFNILDTREAKQKAPTWLRRIGGVSSSYYLLGTPIGFGVAWLCASLLIHQA